MSMVEALAHPWAAAVFARANETKRQDAWSQTLLVLEQGTATDAWQRIQTDARRDHAQQAQLLIEACGDLLDDEGRNLVRLLAAFRRIGLARELRRQFQALCDRQAGVVEVGVDSAFAETGEDKTLLAALRQLFGPTLRVVRRIDPALIGGVVIRQGDRVLDASLRGSLERAARHLRV